VDIREDVLTKEVMIRDDRRDERFLVIVGIVDRKLPIFPLLPLDVRRLFGFPANKIGGFTGMCVIRDCFPII
jgi:hypothetical protein